MSKIRDVRQGIRLRTRRKAPRLHLRAAMLFCAATLMASSIALAGNLDKVAYFHIKAQSLEKALLQFGEQAHVQIVFASKAAMRRLQATALNGEYTGRQALAALLKGSRFEYVENGDTAEIVPSGSMPSHAHSHYIERTAPAERETVPAREHMDPETVPSPKDSKLKPQHKTALQEVVVTGTHIRDAKPAYPVVTITREQIIASGLPNIGAILRTLPENFGGGDNPEMMSGGGVSGGTTGFGVTSANLRGLGNGSTLTLLDGHRLAYDGITSGIDLSIIPTIAVRKIEIQKGGSSAIYGSDAVAGVVNVLTRNRFNGEETSAYDQITSAGGGFTQRYSQLVGRTYPKGRFLAAYEYDAANEIRANQRAVSFAAGQHQFLLPKLRSHSAFINSKYHVTTRLRASLEGVYTHRTSYVETSFPVTSLDTVSEFSSSSGLAYSSGDHTAVGFDVSAAGSDEMIESGVHAGALQSTSSDQTRSMGLNVYESGKLISSRAGGILMAVGAGVRRESLNNESTLVSLHGKRNIGYAYLELHAPLIRASRNRPGLNTLTLTIAERYEHYSDFGMTENPSIGFIYVPQNRIKLAGTWGTSFRAPTLFELNQGTQIALFPGMFFGSLTPGSEVLFKVGGNPRLQPETAHTWSASVIFSPRDVDAKVSAFGINYRNRIENPITQLSTVLTSNVYHQFVVTDPSTALQTALINNAQLFTNPFSLNYTPSTVEAAVFDNYVNVGSQEIAGVDARVRYHRNTNAGLFTFGVAASWLRFKQKITSGQPSEAIAGTIFNPPKFKARVVFGWQTSALAAHVYVNHTSSERYTGVVRAEHIRSWTTVDGQFAYTKTHLWETGRQAVVNISILNLFNVSPPRIDPFATAPLGIGYDEANASAIGRAFSMNMEFRW